MPKTINPYTDKFSTKSGKDVKDTQMLKGEASDSLSGKNVTQQWVNSGPGCDGKMGGLPSRQ